MKKQQEFLEEEVPFFQKSKSVLPYDESQRSSLKKYVDALMRAKDSGRIPGDKFMSIQYEINRINKILNTA